MADGVCPGPHRGGASIRSSIGARDAVLADSAGPWCGPASTFPTVARTRRRRGRLMKFLLVPQEQITASKAPRALGAFERLLLGMRPLVALQMFQTSKRALAGAANVWARLVRLGRRESGGRLGVDGDGRGCECKNSASVEAVLQPHRNSKTGRESSGTTSIA